MKYGILYLARGHSLIYYFSKCMPFQEFFPQTLTWITLGPLHLKPFPWLWGGTDPSSPPGWAGLFLRALGCTSGRLAPPRRPYPARTLRVASPRGSLRCGAMKEPKGGWTSQKSPVSFPTPRPPYSRGAALPLLSPNLARAGPALPVHHA